MSVAAPVRHGVFISYARADGERAAREIHARLQQQAPDIAAWLDRFEIEGGVGWWIQRDPKRYPTPAKSSIVLFSSFAKR